MHILILIIILITPSMSHISSIHKHLPLSCSMKAPWQLQFSCLPWPIPTSHSVWILLQILQWLPGDVKLLGFHEVCRTQRHFRWPYLAMLVSVLFLSIDISFFFYVVLLIKVGPFFNTVFLVFRVLHTSKRTDLSSALKSQNGMLSEILLAFQTFNSWLNAALSSVLIAFTSASIPTCLSMILPRKQIMSRLPPRKQRCPVKL